MASAWQLWSISEHSLTGQTRWKTMIILILARNIFVFISHSALADMTFSEKILGQAWSKCRGWSGGQYPANGFDSRLRGALVPLGSSTTESEKDFWLAARNRLSLFLLLSLSSSSYSLSFSERKKKYTFSPAELSSERGEKEVLADSNQPTAPPSTKSHVSYCAARTRRREKMAAEGTSSTTGRSLLQSVLVSAVDSCHCPHPSHPSTAMLPIAPLSLSDQVWCIQRCDCVNCT